MTTPERQPSDSPEPLREAPCSAIRRAADELREIRLAVGELANHITAPEDFARVAEAYEAERTERNSSPNSVLIQNSEAKDKPADR